MSHTSVSDQNPASSQVPTDAGAASDAASWLAAIAAIAGEEGSFETIGPRHWAFFVDDGTTLMVSFETIVEARGREGQMPLAHDIAASHGWSHLCLIADGETWYRDQDVWDYFDRLVDDAFFDGYARVLFFGSGMGAYAAAAYSVTSPGARVLLISPRATLSPAVASWDDRHKPARRLDFTSRYGYAPDMVEGAAQVVMILDPTVAEDAMHAALFRAPHVRQLHARHAGSRIEWTLANFGRLADVIEAAMKGTLNTASFAQIWRTRRNFGPYLRRLLSIAAANRRTRHEVMICTSVTQRMNSRFFSKRLASLSAPGE